MSSTRFACRGWTGAALRPQRRRSTPAKCGPSPAGDHLHMDPSRRRELTRFAAPAAFLAAATIAVLLIKAGLNNDSEPAAVTTTATTAATTTQPTTTLVLTGTAGSSDTQPPGAQYYMIESGDTLGAIAEKYDTTVEALLALNPDVDPNALHPGDRIRVG